MGFFNCKNCPAREPGCHAYCEEYIEAKKKHEEAKAWLRSEAEIDYYKADNAARIREYKRKRQRWPE